MRLISAAASLLALTIASALAADDDLSAQANAAFLSANAKKPGVTSAQGIQYRVIKSGNGKQPDRHDCATVYYKGNLINGQVFDQTKPGIPATFPVGGVIKGWTEALQLMKAGGKYELWVPPELAYDVESPPSIPPGSLLVFEVELLGVKPTTPPPTGPHPVPAPAAPK